MNEFLIILAASVIIMVLVFLGLSISILAKKDGRFPVTSVGKNIEMKKRGITCVKHDEIKCYGKGKTGGSCCS